MHLYVCHIWHICVLHWQDELEITASLLGQRGGYSGTLVLIRNKATGELVAEGRHSLFGKRTSKLWLCFARKVKPKQCHLEFMRGHCRFQDLVYSTLQLPSHWRYNHVVADIYIELNGYGDKLAVLVLDGPLLVLLCMNSNCSLCGNICKLDGFKL